MDRNKPHSSAIASNQPLSCEICTVKINSTNKVDLGCQHQICLICCQDIFTVAVMNSNLEKLKCPRIGCNVRVLPNSLQNILDKATYENMERMLKWDHNSCPMCNSSLVYETDHIYARCNECGYIYCSQCGNHYHGFDGKCRETFEQNEKDPLRNKSDSVKSEESSNPDDEIECGICFGKFTFKVDFGCSHFHCRTCIRRYLEAKINGGTVFKIQCPMAYCEAEAEPFMIEENVSEEVYIKYDERLLDYRISKDMPEIVNCPNHNCQQRIVSEPDFGYCVDCDLKFCKKCNKGFHGFYQCNQTEEERKAEMRKYMESSESERRELERQADLKRKEHDEAIQKLMTNLCKKCPCCSTKIEKNKGCNHMHCVFCSTHFCWTCLTVLSPIAVALHFATECKMY